MTSILYLKRWREENGLSQHDVAKLLEVSDNVVHNVEHGITTKGREEIEALYARMESRRAKARRKYGSR